MTRMDLDLREEAKFDLERRRARTEASEGEQPGQDDGCGGEGVECFPEPSTGHVVAERLVKTRGSELGIGILERDIRTQRWGCTTASQIEQGKYGGVCVWGRVVQPKPSRGGTISLDERTRRFGLVSGPSHDPDQTKSASP